MRFSPSIHLYGVGPLAALTLFAVFSVPASPTPVKSAMLLPLAPAHVDIKPGFCPNTINTNHAEDELMCVNGAMISVIPISILGNKFDVEQVDVGTLSLSRPGQAGDVVVFPLEYVFHDTGTPFEGEGCDCHALQGDGVLDLDLKFSKQEVIEAFGLGEEPNGTFVQLQVAGVTKSNLEFTGHDCVRIAHSH